MREIEQHFRAALQLAPACGLTVEALCEMLRIIDEEERL